MTKSTKTTKPKTAKKAPQSKTAPKVDTAKLAEAAKTAAAASTGSARRRSSSGAVSTPAPAAEKPKTTAVAAPKTSKATKTEKEKAQALAVVAAKVEKAEKKLEPIAKEINVRFEKAAKLEHDADDHRLAAACRLAEAQQICNDNGVKFKDWVAKHVTQAFETVRKLVAVGSADDPKLALEDMRSNNKAANKKLRDKQKSNRTAGEGEGDEGAFAGASARQKADLDAVKAAFDKLSEGDQLELLFHAAEACGVELPKL